MPEDIEPDLPSVIEKPEPPDFTQVNRAYLQILTGLAELMKDRPADVPDLTRQFAELLSSKGDPAAVAAVNQDGLPGLMAWVQEKQTKALEAKRQECRDVKGLPEHVLRSGETRGGGLGILAKVFIGALDRPIFTSDPKSKAPSVQLDLSLADGEMRRAEIWTTRNGRDAALTVREANMLFTLFNDCFLGLYEGPEGQSYIRGTTTELAKRVGKPRIREVAKCIRTLARVHFVMPSIDGHDVGGPLFQEYVIPDAKAETEDKRRGFWFQLADWLPAEFVQGRFDLVELDKAWSLSNDRARYLYFYLSTHKGSLGNGLKMATLCERTGRSWGKNKKENGRSRERTIKDLDEIAAKTEDFCKVPGEYAWICGRGGNAKVNVTAVGAPGAILANVGKSKTRATSGRATPARITQAELPGIVLAAGQ